jgi:hypothetical protein
MSAVTSGKARHIIYVVAQQAISRFSDVPTISVDVLRYISPVAARKRRSACRIRRIGLGAARIDDLGRPVAAGPTSTAAPPPGE